MKKTFFVTGTDTGVGKTCVTAALLVKAQQTGHSAFGLKPVAAGCSQIDGTWVNEDTLLIAENSSVKLPYAQINPIALKAPAAPHLAAAQEGKRLSIDRIEGLVKGSLMQKADLRLIEGAGGWRVPLGPSESMADLPKRLNLPVILVVGMRLGCLNHALLTAEAIRRDGLHLAGWVGNEISPELDMANGNFETLQFCLQAPCLGRIPYLSSVNVEKCAGFLTLPE